MGRDKAVCSQHYRFNLLAIACLATYSFFFLFQTKKIIEKDRDNDDINTFTILLLGHFFQQKAIFHQDANVDKHNWLTRRKDCIGHGTVIIFFLGK